MIVCDICLCCIQLFSQKYIYLWELKIKFYFMSTGQDANSTLRKYYYFFLVFLIIIQEEKITFGYHKRILLI